MNCYGNNDYRDYLVLQHHGILGMKWGKRNGPPYPLGSGDHSVSEKKAGWRKSLSRGLHGSTKKRAKKASNTKQGSIKLTDAQKRALKIGAIAVGSAIAVAGGIYLAKSGKIDIGKNAVNSIINGGINDVDDLGFKRLSKPIDAAKAARTVNPNNFSFKHAMNCGNSSIAWEARLRGLDVQAGPNEQGMTLESLASCFKGIHSNTFKDINVSSIPILDVNKSITDAQLRSRGQKVWAAYKAGIAKDMPDNSRGILSLPTMRGGHFMTWQKDANGVVTIYNPQDASVTKTQLNAFAGLLINPRNTTIQNPYVMRTDDLQFSSGVKDVIKNYIGDDYSNPTNNVRKVSSNSFVTINPTLLKYDTAGLSKKESVKYQKDLLKKIYKSR